MEQLTDGDIARAPNRSVDIFQERWLEEQTGTLVGKDDDDVGEGGAETSAQVAGYMVKERMAHEAYRVGRGGL